MHTHSLLIKSPLSIQYVIYTQPVTPPEHDIVTRIILSRHCLSLKLYVFVCVCVCVRTHLHGCFGYCICMAARVSLCISARVFPHNDIVICCGVAGESLNPELSQTMTSSLMLKQGVCLSVMGPSTLL